MANNDELTNIDILLSRNTAEKSPLLTFKWVCSSLPFGFDPTYVESLDLPFCNVDVSQGWHGAGSFTYYPEFSNISSFSLTLYEDSSMSTLQWLTFWKNQIKVLYPTSAENGSGKAGAYFLPRYYKRNMEFKLLATDNSEVLKVTLINVFPTDTGNLSMDYTQSDRVKLTQTFSCDDQSLDFLKPQSGAASGSTIGSPTVVASTLLEKVAFSSMPTGGVSAVNSFLNVF